MSATDTPASRPVAAPPRLHTDLPPRPLGAPAPSPANPAPALSPAPQAPARRAALSLTRPTPTM